MVGEDKVKFYCKDTLEKYSTEYLRQCKMVLNSLEKKQYSRLRELCPQSFGIDSERLCHLESNAERGKTHKDFSLMCRDCWEVALKKDYSNETIWEEPIEDNDEGDEK